MRTGKPSARQSLLRCPSWRMTANRVGWGPRGRRVRQTNTGYFLDATRCRLAFPTKFTDQQIESGKEIDRIRKEETWQILDRKIIMDE